MTKTQLGRICRFEYGKALTERNRDNGPFDVYGSNGPVGKYSEAYTNGRAVIIGRKGSIGEVHLSSGPCWPIDTTYFVDENCTDCDLEWLFLYLRSLKLADLNKASGIPGLNRTDAYALDVVVPTITNQRRIAACLNIQLAEVEIAQTALKRQLQNAEALFSACSRPIFEGPEAKNWPSIPLGEAGEIVSGITLGRKTNGLPMRPVPYLRVANVKDGYLDLSEVKTIEATEAEIEKWQLQVGDILLTEGGDPDKLGRGTFWSGEVPECIHQNHIFRVRFPQERYLPEFIAAQLGSDYGKKYFVAHAKKTTGIATINQQVLKAFPLLVPSYHVQQRVTSELSNKLKEAETLVGAIRSTLNDITALPARLLSQAFENHV